MPKRSSQAVKFRYLVLPATVLLLACGDGKTVDGLSLKDNYPCSLVFTPTGVTLGPDLTMARPDPAGPVTRDPEGRFYTAASVLGKVLIWSAEGEYLGSFGQTGEGPGDFNGIHNLVVGPDNTLIIRHDLSRWTVFDSTHHFINTFRTSVITGNFGTTSALADGRLLGTRFMNESMAPEPVAVIMNPDGSLDRKIGVRDSIGLLMIDRLSVYDGDSSFWVLPSVSPRMASVPYLMEKFDTSGRLLDSIERRATWYIGEVHTYSRERSLVSYPNAIQMDSSGILLVRTVNRDPGYVKAETRISADLAQQYGEIPVSVIRPLLDSIGALYPAPTLRLEAIDPASRMVLASRVVRSGEYPATTFGTSRLGYVIDRDDDGFATYRMMTWDLVGNGHPACRGE